VQVFSADLGQLVERGNPDPAGLFLCRLKSEIK